MKWTVLLLLGLGLILCMVCAGCSSSSNSAVGQLTINTSSLPAGTVGTAYSYSIPASGGIPPYVWSMSSGTLPVGLKLSSKGVISGTPESAGTVSVTVQVIDSEAVPQGATANFSIAIQTALAVTSLSPPAGTVGVSYSTTLAATGGVSPYTWTLLSGNPPAGLRLSAAGVISGTPTTSGTSTFTVQVADSESTQQTAVAQLNITVNTVHHYPIAARRDRQRSLFRPVSGNWWRDPVHLDAFRYIAFWTEPEQLRCNCRHSNRNRQCHIHRARGRQRTSAGHSQRAIEHHDQ